MGALVVFSIIVAGVVSLIPAIRNWVKTHRCPKCGTWFMLDLVRFDVTDKVTGHDSGGKHGGYLPGLRGGFGGGLSSTKDNPFIREFGKARYLCKKCGFHLTIETHRDKR
jgi:ribosomal protein S27AE